MAFHPRIAIYTHDTFGLGHVRRCLHITRALACRAERASVLLVTGSPALPVLADLPPNADVVKIPTVARTGDRRLRPPHLKIPNAELAALRQRLIRETLFGFGPDVFLVDNFPLGSQGELAPILRELRGTSTRTVLGLRDILDAPEAVRADWERQGIHDVLDRYYDRILVYGMPEVLDTAAAYDLSPASAGKVRYCGYVTDDYSPLPDDAAIRAELGIEGPFILATGGGGGDAFPLLRALLEALPLLPDVPMIMVTGPLMSASQRAELAARINGGGRVTLLQSVPTLRPYLAVASAVVAMCGYNTAAEIVSLGTPAVVVPRTWRYGEHLKGCAAGEEAEQLLRGQALARLGLVDLVTPDGLTAERLARGIERQLARGRRNGGSGLDLTGLGAVTDSLLALAQGTPD
jgi:predicted glycosyltransferase